MPISLTMSAQYLKHLNGFLKSLREHSESDPKFQVPIIVNFKKFLTFFGLKRTTGREPKR